MTKNILASTLILAAVSACAGDDGEEPDTTPSPSTSVGPTGSVGPTPVGPTPVGPDPSGPGPGGSVSPDVGPADGPVARVQALTADLANGQSLYSSACGSVCHGADGQGVPNLGSALTETLAGKSDAEVIQTVYFGVAGTLMVGFGEEATPNGYSDQEVRDVTAYIIDTFAP